ncbi:hypothetical protein SALBM217S_01285 [Streptomyces griseoloalbus]
MLHLRLITPSGQTEDAVRLIEKTVGTTHLCVLTGAARDPAGDVVLCDVARESADDLLSGLKNLNLDTTGSIAVENVDLSLSDRADRAEKEAPGEGADAVLWEQLTEATHEESTLSVTYLAFLTLATMIAACGVVLDNAILIVGAMAGAPEFGPLAGISTAAVQRKPRLALRSLTALLVGFAAAIVLTVLFSLFMDAVGLFTQRQLEGERPQTGFVYAPDWFSFVVAVLAGAAGTLSLTSAKSGALVGVAISVTTVPAAANAAVALSYGDTTQSLGIDRATPAQPAGHHPGGNADPADAEAPVAPATGVAAHGAAGDGLGVVARSGRRVRALPLSGDSIAPDRGRPPPPRPRTTHRRRRYAHPHQCATLRRRQPTATPHRPDPRTAGTHRTAPRTSAQRHRHAPHRGSQPSADFTASASRPATDRA